MRTKPAAFWLYERMFPEAAWLGGRVTVWHGDIAIWQLSGGSLWTGTDVSVAGERASGPRLPSNSPLPAGGPG